MVYLFTYFQKISLRKYLASINTKKDSRRKKIISKRKTELKLITLLQPFYERKN